MTRATRIIPSVRPPVPQNQGPGFMDVAFTISSGALEALDGETVDFPVLEGDEHLDAMFCALTRAVPQIGDFFAAAIVDGFDEDELRNVMRTYGRSVHSETVPIGSLVLLDGHWLLVLGSGPGKLTSALRLRISDAEGVFQMEKLVDMPNDRCRTIWTPTSERILRDDSQIGMFWSPILSRYRSLLSSRPGFLPDLLDAVFPSFRFDTSSFAAVMNTIEPELYPMAPELPLWAGSILLTEEDDEIAVVLPGGEVLGVRADHQDNSAAVMDLDEFQPAYVWYPRL